MKKLFLILTFASITLILLYAITISKALDGINSPPIYITEHSLGVQYSIKFLYLNSPLSASYIQVRKINKETNEEYLLENIGHYDNMIGYCLRGDSLIIFLRQGYWLGRRHSNSVECDTFHININNTKWKLK